MKRETPYSDDYEQALADKIVAYWSERGHVVEVWLEGLPQHARYPRSNLLNGLPQDRPTTARREAAE